ncbi:MAG: ABC transporter permease [Omnitrophica WOR_2 bacterium]
MSKFWKVVRHEYTRHVLRKRFLFGMFSVPVMVVVMVGVVLLIALSQESGEPAGYVDHSGLLSQAVPLPPPGALQRVVKFIPFSDEANARQALDSGKIQAYFVLEADYLKTGDARLVSLKEPSQGTRDQFRAFVRASLLARQPEDIALRLSQGDNLVVRAADGSRQLAQGDWFNLLLPIFAGLAFMMAIFTTSGYLMQAVVEEKENRTMEVLVTSVSPLQLMAGKIIGLIGVGLTQFLGWIGFGVLGILVGRNYFSWMQSASISLSVLLWSFVILIPSFVMVASLMVAVGSTVTEAREGQQISGLFTLPIVIPYWFVALIMKNPNGLVSQVLSFFPLTAPVTLTLRMAFAAIPTWQLGLNLLDLALVAALAVWLAGRAFRLGMLQYGQRLTLRQIVRRQA